MITKITLIIEDETAIIVEQKQIEVDGKLENVGDPESKSYAKAHGLAEIISELSTNDLAAIEAKWGITQ